MIIHDVMTKSLSDLSEAQLNETVNTIFQRIRVLENDDHWTEEDYERHRRYHARLREIDAERAKRTAMCHVNRV